MPTNPDRKADAAGQSEVEASALRHVEALVKPLLEAFNGDPLKVKAAVSGFLHHLCREDMERRFPIGSAIEWQKLGIDGCIQGVVAGYLTESATLLLARNEGGAHFYVHIEKDSPKLIQPE